MAQPLLHRAQIDTCPEAPSSESCTELVKPEVVFVELRTLCNTFQAVQEVELWLASGSREDQTARLVSFRLPRLQTSRQLRRNRNLAFFVGLRSPSPVRFVADTNGRMGEVDIRPVRV